MKKLVSLILALTLVFTLCACGAKTDEPAVSEIEKLFGDGYRRDMSGLTDDVFSALMISADDTDYIKVTAKVTEDEIAAYEGFSIFDEDYDRQLDDFVRALKDPTIENVSDRLPTDEELDAMVGKTIGELEDEGFEQTGYCYSDTDTFFQYANNCYELMIYPAEPLTTADQDTMSPADIRALTVARAEFSCVSWGIIE